MILVRGSTSSTFCIWVFSRPIAILSVLSPLIFHESKGLYVHSFLDYFWTISSCHAHFFLSWTIHSFLERKRKTKHSDNVFSVVFTIHTWDTIYTLSSVSLYNLQSFWGLCVIHCVCIIQYVPMHVLSVASWMICHLLLIQNYFLTQGEKV